ncbi:MAG: TolC family outer membrane protein [Rhodanobacteraceae bacterium]|nr:TolC family outer membrane protein [Rhodanobacteraceae bacterium]MBK7044900.1 TolC family outer membrane protein [Rhodanobacteraceae bacterium]MBP9153398.1 TolC family outer membrane protein [Xanthomonadales bacterium]HQW82418.1 TolC family outer membrane protein [Pseudomonadota bacterium]
MAQRFILRLSALALAISGSAFGADLMEVYDKARAGDPQFAAAEAGRLAAEQGVPLARSLLLPQLSAGWNKNRSESEGTIFSEDLNRDVTFSTTSRNSSKSLQLQQSIYDHGNYMSLRAAKAQAARGDADYDAASDALLVRVAEAYFGVLTAQTNLTSADAEEKAVGRQLEQAEQRFEVGLTAITDVHEARARYDGARAAVILARNALDDTFEGLIELTGAEVESVKPLKENIELARPQPDSLEQWVETAIGSNPTLAALQRTVDGANYSAKAAWSDHLPSLGLSGSYSQQDSGGDVGPFSARDPQNNSLSLSLSIPLFSGGATNARYKQSLYDRDAAQDRLEQQRRAIVRQTRGAFRGVAAGISEVEARQQALVSAKSALEATEAGFEVGTRTIVDVLLSQQQQFAAEREYARARHSYILANLKLKQAAGTIDVADLKSVNAMLQ